MTRNEYESDAYFVRVTLEIIFKLGDSIMINALPMHINERIVSNIFGSGAVSWAVNCLLTDWILALLEWGKNLNKLNY